MTRTLRWLTVYLLLLGMAVTYGFWVDHQQDVARCRERNEATRVAVSIVVDGLTEAAVDADPERVERFREDINRRVMAAEIDCT